VTTTIAAATGVLCEVSEIVRYPAVEGPAERTRKNRVVASLPILLLVGKGRIGIEKIVDSRQQFQGGNGLEGHVAIPYRIIAHRDEVTSSVRKIIGIVLNKVVVQTGTSVLISPVERQLVLITNDRLTIVPRFSSGPARSAIPAWPSTAKPRRIARWRRAASTRAIEPTFHQGASQ